MSFLGGKGVSRLSNESKIEMYPLSVAIESLRFSFVGFLTACFLMIYRKSFKKPGGLSAETFGMATSGILGASIFGSKIGFNCGGLA